MSKWFSRAKSEIPKASSYHTDVADNRDDGFTKAIREAHDLSAKRALMSVMTVKERWGSKIPTISRNLLLMIRQNWDDEMKPLLRWFHSKPEIPEAPFVLKQGVKICDRSMFYDSLIYDVSEGPNGPRCMYGALRDDLINLQRVVLSTSEQTTASTEILNGGEDGIGEYFIA